MAVLDEIERLDLISNAAEVGDRLTAELKERVSRHEVIGDARGYGLFLGVEMIKNEETREPDAPLALSMSDRLKDKGFLTSYSGRFNNVLKIRPPLVFSQQNADDFLAAFDECMEEMAGGRS